MIALVIGKIFLNVQIVTLHLMNQALQTVPALPTVQVVPTVQALATVQVVPTVQAMQTIQAVPTVLTI